MKKWEQPNGHSVLKTTSFSLSSVAPPHTLISGVESNRKKTSVCFAISSGKDPCFNNDLDLKMNSDRVDDRRQ